MSDNTVINEFNTNNEMPSFDDFKVVKEENEQVIELIYEGEIEDYFIDFSIMLNKQNFKYGSKAYIVSHDGVALDNLEELPIYDVPEDAYDAMSTKLVERIKKLQRSGVTGAFPFITI